MLIGNSVQINLLIVDDEKSIRNGIANAIDWNCYDISNVFVAENGKEALSIIENKNIHIVITDIKMPIMNGLELIELAKKINEKIKFIIISGYSDFGFAKKAITFGVSSYLLKPIIKDELIKEITILKNKFFKISIDDTHIGNDLKRNQFFNKLFFNNFDSQDALIVEMKNLDLNYSAKNICVIIIENESVHSEIISHFAFKPLLIGKYNNVIVVENTNETNIYEICKNFIDNINHDFSRKPVISIGSIVADYTLLYRSFNDACEFLKYKIYHIDIPIYHKGLISNKQVPILQSYITLSSDIIENILTGNESELNITVDKFFSFIFFTELPPPSYIKGMCYYLLISVQKGISKFLIEENNIVTTTENTYIENIENIDSLKIFIKETMQQYLFYLGNNSSNKINLMMEKSKKFIDINLTNKLSLEDVANHLHLSENYFAALFKKYTGESFRNYVIRLKIEKSKHLLISGKHNISEISDMLGYEDYRSFNRVFKKYTGFAPSDYINNMH